MSNLIVEKKIEGIKNVCKDFLRTNSDVNEFLDLFDNLTNENNLISSVTERELCKVYTQLIQVGHLKETKLHNKRFTNEMRLKLIDNYIKLKNHLFHTLATLEPSNDLNQLLINLITLLSDEAKYPYENVDYPYFPEDFLTNVLKSILRSDQLMNELIDKYKEYFIYEDIKFFTLKSLKSILNERRTVNDTNETFLRNVFHLLSSIKLPKLSSKKSRNKTPDELLDELNHQEINLLCKPIDVNLKTYTFKYQKTAIIFSTVWVLFISFKMPITLTRKILIILDDNVMPHFANPLTLTDFLINSFNVGGSVSLLSLSSLFILIQKCNLDYPDFYNKLYTLFEPSILHVKYRARFFFWSDIFLSSTHLPEYLVGAFAKKLSRMSLNAPIDALYIILPFIKNLMIRHPNLSKLLNRKIIEKDLKLGNADDVNNKIIDDPFDDNEKDIFKCNALESSLWELKTLQSHWNPKIAEDAKFINKPIGTKEVDLSSRLETNFEYVIKMESKTAAIDSTEQINDNLYSIISNYWN